MSLVAKYIEEIVDHCKKYGYDPGHSFSIPSKQKKEIIEILDARGYHSQIYSEWNGLCKMFVADKKLMKKLKKTGCDFYAEISDFKMDQFNNPIETSFLTDEIIQRLATTSRAARRRETYPQVNITGSASGIKGVIDAKRSEWLRKAQNAPLVDVDKLTTENAEILGNIQFISMHLDFEELEKAYYKLPEDFKPTKLLLNPVNRGKFETYKGIEIEYKEAIKENKFLFV
ncbi:hypothetical protein JM79_3233 [Gramella sp. Hel_I_59]|uniref:hypothetical protein n=1 Tax=Gramella sp. Hel_I_59 TaxID=1249978 RepID=UPI00114D71D2|nr:hypothetical protein [Gramella sp. Hel_I_59]TQI72276.1 hypothetical protein JM79_3233 [Gramella sp. Hel_I_59]